MASSDLVLGQTHFEALRLGRSDQFVIGHGVTTTICEANLESFQPFNSFLDKGKEIVESNENMRLPKIPTGTRDFDEDQMTTREKVLSKIQCVFKKYCATALDTPIFELRETLVGKYGENSKLLYDLANQAGERCSLRYDLTAPFARYVAMKGLPSFKGYQTTKVYKRDKPSKGRYKEFYQCDFDIAGSFEQWNLISKLSRSAITRSSEERNGGGEGFVCGDCRKNWPLCQVERSSNGAIVSAEAEGSKFLANASSKEVLDEFNIMFEALKRSKHINKFVFDLSLARGLDYYTCVIFETVCIGAEVGTIGAGERYANLIGMFGPRQVLAIGVSLMIERVFKRPYNTKYENMAAIH
ncbi:unnamed protein product [Cochlearia groenlandica]